MTARFFTCSIPGCERPSVRGTGGCDLCNRQMCVIHLSPTHHTCNTILDNATYISQTVAEITRLQSQINDEAICTHASSLNGDRDCSIEHSSTVGANALMGRANYHARIRFHDGSPSWLLRVPRVASYDVGFAPELVEYLICSEFATLKFLEGTGVPAPRAFGYGIKGGGDYGVGVGFILMEELRGKAWMGERASEEEKRKVWSGLAEILKELGKYPFPKAGSLLLDGSDFEVSAVASDRFLVLSPRGPFASSTAYYVAFAEQYLELIADRQLYTEYPIDAYLVYRFLRDNAGQLGGTEEEEEMFYLKHVDDKGDHFLVDENLNITGIIDWQMARVVPAREAFGPSLVTADMSALCGGRVSLSANDLALADLLQTKGVPEASNVMDDEKVRRFFWGLAIESEWKYALPLAKAILEVFGVREEWEVWRERVLREYGDDERLSGIMAWCSEREGVIT